MRTALDTNVLVALWDDSDLFNTEALLSLELADSKGQIVISGLVYAELLACPGRSESFLNTFLSETRIVVDWSVSKDICLAAGRAYTAYSEKRRKSKQTSPRRILTDFLIGAHALENDYCFLTFDDKIFRKAFPKLRFAETK